MADGETHLSYLRKGWIIVVPLGILLSVVCYSMGIPYYFLYLPLSYLNYYLCEYQDPDDDLYGASTSEGRLLRETKRVNVIVGFFGAWFVGQKIVYAYIANLFGGHRSWFSHGLITGVLGRMIFYNIIFFGFLYFMFGFGVTYWGWTNIYMELYFDVWLTPFLITQFIVWQFADIIHIILDTKWAKGTLYIPIKDRTKTYTNKTPSVITTTKTKRRLSAKTIKPKKRKWVI